MKNKAAQQLGRLGGKSTSKVKTAAVRENGKLGGRPREDASGETAEMRRTRERVQYWEDRRNEATTEKELNYCREMELKAHRASSKAIEQGSE